MPQIPNKLYFRIGEVSDLVGVKPYVLRYWESEFTDIKPSKSKSGQRLYKRRDVELLLRIKELLYEERFTINGARKRLKDFARGEPHGAEAPEPATGPGDGPAEAAEAAEAEGGPRQLEVFGEVEADQDDDEPLDLARAAHAGAPHDRGSVKAFQKIKRDLEELLSMMKS
ncbi:MAG: MerR family transcriptional regulator [Proteobacteria bacterium]|nr:MerR family transcriptional regulator [Pseudomonadota bacterium]